MPREVLLVGSVPFVNAETVFKEVGTRLKCCAPRIPDGETGERLSFISFQWIRLRQVDGLQVVSVLKLEGPVPVEIPRFRLAPGRTAQSIDIGRLGYDAIAIKSYEDFKRARNLGHIAEGVRFQVSVPPPAALAAAVEGPLEEILPLFERAMRDTIEGMVAAIPAKDLAIQWDLAFETVHEERRRRGSTSPPVFADPAYTTEALLDSAARIANAVPPNVELGIHFCYGDAEGDHIIEPADASVPTDLANALSDRITRPIAYLHMPVPISRDDQAYFEPLKHLRLKKGTRLFLGLIHQEDGVEGAKRRIRAAEAVVQDFGVATECGLGRIAPTIIPRLLDLHREVAQL